jgi:hypothetical protein
MKSRNGLHKGHLVAAVLAGSWRSSNYPRLEITEAGLDEVTPLICKSGAAALAWRRIRATSLADSEPARILCQSYRHQSLQAALHEQQVEKVFRLFREAQVEAALVKGWAASTLYDQNDLRPSGDIDLNVRPENFDQALAILGSPDASDCSVDLHTSLSEISERSFDELLARSQLVQLGQEQIRILGAEDHFALLCIHFLKHGGWRPLWLCDISAAIESLPPHFDWDICFGTNQQRARWIVCAIGLAERLLGANVHQVPRSRKEMHVPAWVGQTVLYHWSRLFPGDSLPMRPAPLMADTLKQRRDVLKGIVNRWPDPITATFNLDGQFNDFPRFPYQLADFLRSGARFMFALPAKRQSEPPPIT